MDSCVNGFLISPVGYGAGPDQGRENPLGKGGKELQQWAYPTRTFQREVFRNQGVTGRAQEE